MLLRVRSSTGQHRVELEPNSTWDDFLLLFYSLRPDISLSSMKFSKTGRPQDLISACQTDLISTLGLQHGDLITLIEPKPASSSSAAAVPPSFLSSSSKLTPQCNHSEDGACINCRPSQPGEKIIGKCNHPASAKCVHCSDFAQDLLSGKKLDTPAAWMCQHAPTAFCPKCLPQSTDDIKLKPSVSD